MTEFRYLTAKEWGMVWARPPVAEKQLDGECFVHHSAGSHVDDAVQAFRNLNTYAINSKGYSALDYDVLVHRNKQTGLVTIGEGRGPWMSAATYNRNEEGEAVCVLGYFHPGSTLSRKPHPDEVEGVALAIKWAMVEGWVSPDTKIMGHRDNPAAPGATGCPGDYLQAELPTIRARVSELTAPTPTPPKDDMELFTLKAHPAPLYQRVGNVVRWISPDVWAVMGKPAPGRVMPEGEAKTYFISGPSPDGSGAFLAQVA